MIRRPPRSTLSSSSAASDVYKRQMYYLVMTLGGANVWSNFSYGSLIDTPNGWLLNPQGSYLILFERCKKSSRKNIKVYTHLFYANELGEPWRLKNTRLHDLESAIETWNELIAGGWIEVTTQFQKLA